MDKKKWIPAEVIDLTVQCTEANVETTPTHDSSIVGYVNDIPIIGHS